MFFLRFAGGGEFPLPKELFRRSSGSPILQRLRSRKFQHQRYSFNHLRQAIHHITSSLHLSNHHKSRSNKGHRHNKDNIRANCMPHTTLTTNSSNRPPSFTLQRCSHFIPCHQRTTSSIRHQTMALITKRSRQVFNSHRRQ